MQGFFIPLEKLCHAILDLDLMRPAERVKFRDIDELAHGAIRLGRIVLTQDDLIVIPFVAKTNQNGFPYRPKGLSEDLLN
jgi:hypothetical protein